MKSIDLDKLEDGVQIKLPSYFNEDTGMIEQIVVSVGTESQDFKQLDHVSIQKEYYQNGKIVHAEWLFGFPEEYKKDLE